MSGVYRERYPTRPASTVRPQQRHRWSPACGELPGQRARLKSAGVVPRTTKTGVRGTLADQGQAQRAHPLHPRRAVSTELCVVQARSPRLDGGKRSGTRRRRRCRLTPRHHLQNNVPETAAPEENSHICRPPVQYRIPEQRRSQPHPAALLSPLSLERDDDGHRGKRTGGMTLLETPENTTR